MSAAATVKGNAGFSFANLVIRLAALEAWFVEMLQKMGALYSDAIAGFAQAVTNSPKLQALAPVSEAVGEVFRTTEAMTSVILNEILRRLFAFLHIPVNESYYGYIIIAITMAILLYQFSVKRYFELKKKKEVAAKALAEQALKEAQVAAGAKKGIGIVLGGIVGGVIFLGNPLGFALGGLVGSMFSDSTTTEDKKVAQEGVDKTLVVEATLRGLLSCVIYSVLLMAILFLMHSPQH